MSFTIGIRLSIKYAASSLLGCLIPAAAVAQAANSPTLVRPGQTVSPSAPTNDVDPANTGIVGETPPAAATSLNSASPSCKQYDRYNTRSQTIEVQTPACQTIAPELGGARSFLAEHGFGLQAAVLGGVNYDVLGHKDMPQLYGGERPTGNTEVSASLTYDLSRLGVPGDTQLTVRGAWLTNTFFASSRYAGFSVVAINQRFMNGAIELQYGYFPLVHSFYGFILGGNSAAAAFGPQSNVLVSVGASGFSPTPTFQLILRDPKTQRFYNNFIVSRSTSPLGLADEVKRNKIGLRFSLKGDEPLFLDEIGYKRDASNESKGLWLRFGGLYNTTNYIYLDPRRGKSSSGNWAAYGAVTAQLTQVGGGTRGLYIDAKYDWSPASVNVFAHDYNATLFYLGPISGHPYDMASLGWTESYFSKAELATLNQLHVAASQNTKSFTASYAANVLRGVYLVTSLSRTWHPTLAPTRPAALILTEALHFSF